MKRVVVLMAICAFILFFSPIAAANEPVKPEFTIQKAVQAALVHSATIKVGEYDIDRTYEVRQFAAQNLEFVPEGFSTAEATRPFYALQQADISWQMSKKNLNLQKDKVEMSARKLYNEVLQALEQVKASEATLKYAERQRITAVASLKTGIINKQAMIQAEGNLANAKAGYEEVVKVLDDTYQKFNQLVGLYPEDRPVLTEVPVFEKVVVDNLDGYIARSLEDNPSLWLVEKEVDVAKKTLQTHDFQGSTPYKARELDVDKAITSASDARDQARKALRSLYYNITALEEKYQPAVEQIRIAEENLRIAKLKYEVGMATITDVTEAETSLIQAEQQLLNLVCQHDILKLAFDKPWAYLSN